MAQSTETGPAADGAFFEAVRRLFAQHPEAAAKYSITFTGYQTDAVGADRSATGRSWSEGDRVVTTFVETAADADPGDSCGENGYCMQWTHGPDPVTGEWTTYCSLCWYFS